MSFTFGFRLLTGAKCLVSKISTSSNSIGMDAFDWALKITSAFSQYKFSAPIYHFRYQYSNPNKINSGALVSVKLICSCCSTNTNIQYDIQQTTGFYQPANWKLIYSSLFFITRFSAWSHSFLFIGNQLFSLQSEILAKI